MDFGTFIVVSRPISWAQSQQKSLNVYLNKEISRTKRSKGTLKVGEMNSQIMFILPTCDSIKLFTSNNFKHISDFGSLNIHLNALGVKGIRVLFTSSIIVLSV